MSVHHGDFLRGVVGRVRTGVCLILGSLTGRESRRLIGHRWTLVKAGIRWDGVGRLRGGLWHPTSVRAASIQSVKRTRTVVAHLRSFFFQRNLLQLHLQFIGFCL